MTDPTSHISRRTVVTGAALAVPAVAVLATTPAFAASGGPTVTTSAPNGQASAGNATPITALVKDEAGKPAAGQSVSFTGSNGTTFSPTTATTDSDGKATSNMTITDPWATPGSTVTASATALGVTGTSGITVLGANAYAAGRNWYSERDDRTKKLYGKLGTGSTAEILTTPAQLVRVFPSPIVTIADSRNHALVLLEDGTVWALGNNIFGQLGDGTLTTRSTWAPVQGLSNATQIAASLESSYALLKDGTVMAWGNNGDGRLGNQTAGNLSKLPVTVDNVTNAKQISAGAFSGYAVLGDGTVKAWGTNSSSQLGTTKPKDSSGNELKSPVTVPNITTATQITGGARSAYALLQDGTVMTWGEIIGTTSSPAPINHTPVAVDGISNVTVLAAGDTDVYALLADRTVRAWGAGSRGQLGSGDNNPSTTPVAVQNVSGVTQLSASFGSGYVIGDSGIHTWGWNEDGQLANGGTDNQNSPGIVTGGMANVIRFGSPCPIPASGWFIRST